MVFPLSLGDFGARNVAPYVVAVGQFAFLGRLDD